jgi:hypothetical protein
VAGDLEALADDIDTMNKRLGYDVFNPMSSADWPTGAALREAEVLQVRHEWLVGRLNTACYRD